MTITTNLILAFGSALFMAVFGYLKNKPTEDFSPEKLVATFLAGLVIALLNVQWQVPIETGEEMFTIFWVNTGFVGLLERVFKTVYRHWIQPWVDRLD